MENKTWNRLLMQKAGYAPVLGIRDIKWGCCVSVCAYLVPESDYYYVRDPRVSVVGLVEDSSMYRLSTLGLHFC